MFAFKSDHGRWILDETSIPWTEGGVTIFTGAKIQVPGGSPRRAGKRHTPRLQFQLKQKPIQRSLLELDGRDAGRDLAAALMTQWECARTAGGRT